MEKVKLVEVPADSKLKAGDWVTGTGAELDALRASGHKFITAAEDRLIKARETAVDLAIKASKAFAPKENTDEIRATAIALEAQKDGLGVQYIQNIPAKKEDNITARLTKGSIDDGGQ